MRGYDRIVNLSHLEKEVTLCNIFYPNDLIAWLLDNDSYKSLAMRNREMLVWIWENR